MSTAEDAGDYPPAHHVLRDLPFEIEVVSARHQRAHLSPSFEWRQGTVAVVVDVVGGSLCAAVVAPDWMATSGLELGMLPAPPDTSLVLDATVLRAGRRSVTIEAVLSGADGATVGTAVLDFSRLQRREDNLDLSDRDVAVGARYGFGSSTGATADLVESHIGQRVLDATIGATCTDLVPYVRNSFGALNGGVAAALAARSAELVVGGAGRAQDVAVHHLGQGREGPVTTTARVVLDRPGRTLARVELRDAGAPSDDGHPGGRLMVVAHVGVG